MTWCNDCSDVQTVDQRSSPTASGGSNNKIVVRTTTTIPETHRDSSLVRTCPSCGHQIKYCRSDKLQQGGGGVNDLPGLPAGVKFDPTDYELLEHLEAKVRSDVCRLHPLLDEFIPTIDGENGICYTHPEKLPGVNKDGLVRHFFHRPSKAYTTGTRKRRKVHTDAEGGETRWHKTGKTRAVLINGKVKGYKKILVLYTNYGKQRKPEKTNWVMHQYHLGHNEEEKDGELVVSKVFYQTQPRQCGSVKLDLSMTKQNVQINQMSGGDGGGDGGFHHDHHPGSDLRNSNGIVVQYYNNNSQFVSFDHQAPSQSNTRSSINPTHLLPHFTLNDASFIP